MAQPLHQPPVSEPPALGSPGALAAHHATLISSVPWVTDSLPGWLFLRQLTPTEARQRLAQVATTWLNQSGNARVVLQGNSATKPGLSLESSLLLPLYQTHQQLFLLQPGVQHHQKQTTYNLGFGSRHWPADESYWWGNHLFYDYCQQGSHHRLGFGGECQTERYRFTVNGYLPLSQWRQVNQQPWETRAARGFDLQLQRQFWQQPCLYLNTLFEHYWGQSLVSVDKAKPSQCPTTLTLAIDYIPVPLVTASYGCQWASGGKLSHQSRIQLTYRLGIPLAQQIDPGLAAVVYTPAVNRLAVIQRRSQLVLEQRARWVNTPDAPSKQVEDTIQLTIPASAQGEPGASLTLKMTLDSSCSATEWNYFGEGSFIRADSAYSVKADEGKLALQLPQQPGQYSLRLRAQKINGQDSDSNEMIVKVDKLSARTERTRTLAMTVDDQTQSESDHPTDREEAASNPPTDRTASVSPKQQAQPDAFSYRTETQATEDTLADATTSSSSQMVSQGFDSEQQMQQENSNNRDPDAENQDPSANKLSSNSSSTVREKIPLSSLSTKDDFRKNIRYSSTNYIGESRAEKLAAHIEQQDEYFRFRTLIEIYELLNIKISYENFVKNNQHLIEDKEVIEGKKP